LTHLNGFFTKGSLTSSLGHYIYKRRLLWRTWPLDRLRRWPYRQHS
jgi:hypothetical protein